MNIMKNKIFDILVLTLSCFGLHGCFNLEEEVFDRVNNDIYYQDESSIQGAVASIYNTAARSYAEYFWYLQEFSADQIAWRSWNGGLWGYDDAAKYVISTHNWNSESVIIRQAWENAWTTIGLCNTVIEDLNKLDPADLRMTQEGVNSYISEVRTLRAWAYYNIFEIWGGALPLNTSTSGDIPPTADPDFNTSCQKIYDFISTELDESWANLPQNEVNRMNQAANRMIKARLLLNSGVFTGTDRFTECETLCDEILGGTYGTYSLADDYRDIYSIDNTSCPEVIMAFACELGQLNLGWMRVTMLPYNFWDYCGGTYDQDPWNCCCLAPSYDNSGTVNTDGGSTGAVCFLDAPYNDKLGAVYERFDDRDIRKQNFTVDASNEYHGQFLIGAIRANFGTGDPLEADADRQGRPLVYVDQVGTFMNMGLPLAPVMSPRWGETNSGVRFLKYPIYPTSSGIDFQNIDEVEFRLAEVVYMKAECRLRAGDTEGAKDLVNSVRERYFSADDWADAEDDFGPAYTTIDEYWMLNEWGKEFLGEGRRRRTDLRRFDKFTQGQWWFFGRTEDNAFPLPATRDRKYEWFPLPESALMVNTGLIQNPNY